MTQNQLEVKGNVSGILLARRRFNFNRQKGVISGAVITGGFA